MNDDSLLWNGVRLYPLYDENGKPVYGHLYIYLGGRFAEVIYGCDCQKNGFYKCDNEHICKTITTFEKEDDKDIKYIIEIKVFISNNYSERIYKVSFTEENLISGEIEITINNFNSSFNLDEDFLAPISDRNLLKYVPNELVKDHEKFREELKKCNALKYKTLILF